MVQTGQVRSKARASSRGERDLRAKIVDHCAPELSHRLHTRNLFWNKTRCGVIMEQEPEGEDPGEPLLQAIDKGDASRAIALLSHSPDLANRPIRRFGTTHDCNRPCPHPLHAKEPTSPSNSSYL